MTVEPAKAPALELAHVLFMDIVAYSMLPMEEQEKRQAELQAIVRSTSEFARAQSEDGLIRLPTGDGMALVFFGDPEAPVRCALEIAQGLRTLPEIRLRMGIHTGPVYRVTNINDKMDVAGAGINMAQRVMDCADANHILVSDSAAGVLSQLGRWRDVLHDLGNVPVKHGVLVHVYNLCTASAGNPEVPHKLQLLLHEQPAAIAPATGAPRISAFGRMKAILFAPAHAFAGLELSPTWWAPWLVLSVAFVMLAAVIEYRVGFGALVDAQLQASPAASARFDNLRSEEREAKLEASTAAVRWTSYGFPMVLLAAALLTAAGLTWSFRRSPGANVNFVLSLAIIMYALTPELLRLVISAMMVAANFHLQTFTWHNPLPTNPAYWIDPAAHPVLYAIASCADVFRLWALALAIFGFVRVARVKLPFAFVMTTAWYLIIVTAVSWFKAVLI